MKSLRPVKALRPCLPLPLAALSLFCLGQSANAGSWQLTYQCQGQYQENGTGSPGYPYPRSNSVPWSNDPSTLWAEPIIRHLASDDVSEAGTITATLTWVPSGPGDVPSGTSLSVCETAYAGAYDDSYPYSFADAPPCSGSVSDGLGDPQNVISSGFSASGKHLITIPIVASNGQYTVTLPQRTFNASGSETDSDYNGFPNHCYFAAIVDYSVVQDTRAVTISSNLGQTYHKGSQVDAHGVALPEADTPTVSGVGLATTVVPYVNSPSADTTPDGNCSSNIIYTSHPIGSWADASTYSWQAKIGITDGQTLNGPFGPNTLPGDLGLQYVPADEPGGNVSAGSQEQITITLKDAQDGASATNTYNVTFHAPTENWVLWDSENPFWQGATADSIPDPGYALHNAGITATWTYTDTVWAQAGAAFSAVGGNMVPNPYWAGFLAAASIGFSQVQPKQVQQTVNFNDAWTDTNSTFDPKPADSSLDTMTHYKMVPELYVQYQPQIWRGDGYAANGYTGGVQTAIDKFLRADTAGDFTLITSDPTGGN